MITAWDVEASKMSESVIAPTPLRMILTLTSLFESFSRLAAIASEDPPTSALIIRLSSEMVPFLTPSYVDSSDIDLRAIALTGSHPTLGGDFTRGLFVFDHGEFVTGLRRSVKA